jgi:hypothetical protein
VSIPAARKNGWSTIMKMPIIISRIPPKNKTHFRNDFSFIIKEKNKEWN